ncbi:PQQ-binding-like beta-propeller repeat protein [Candidatus Poribacteria bacterium]|nr:PQQ-binding-like beta-propeller repeat protein [Candidatus Poribacteria bacterium]MYA56842.1 PQQ-binding-like beta-propeller repeat protein [Candidatus Poribacteria bacterium]
MHQNFVERHLFVYIMKRLWQQKYWIVLVLLLVWGCDSQQKEQPQQPTVQQSAAPEATEPLAPPRAEDWHTFMHDVGFSGVSPDKSITPPLELLWKFKTGGPLHASPVIANGILYIGSTDGKLYALDAKQWGIRWVFDAGDAIRYSATVLGNRVYFSARNNKVYALDAKTGEKLWEFKSKSWMDAPPIVSDNKVYVGAFPSKIYLLNARAGTLEAMRERTVRIQGIEYGCAKGVFRPIFPEHNADLWRGQTNGSESYPVTANGVVYIGARNGKLHAFDAVSKSETWTYQLGSFVDAAPAISDGILYAASGDGSVYAFTNATENVHEQETRRQGVVTHDAAPVYTAKEGTAVLLQLNDSVRLPILQVSAGWYEVELPNGVRGWMNKFAFGEFKEIDSILFNTTFCRPGDNAITDPYRVQLIEGAEFPRWSPDGEFIAFLKREDLGGRYWRANELWIMDRKGERARKFYTGNFYNPYLSWSLDSRLVAFEVDENGERFIYTVDWKFGRIKQLVRGDGPAFSPTSNRLVFRRRDFSQSGGLDIIYRINSDSSGLSAIARVPIERRQRTYTYLSAPSWAPDGTRVAFGVNNAKYVGIRIQDIEGQRIKEILTQHQQVHQLDWSADSTHLAYVLSGSNRPGQLIDKQLHLSETVATFTQSQILKHTSPAWSPTGKQLAYMEREDCAGIRWKVWVYDLESGKKFPIARTPMKLTSVVWMPDGKHLCLWQTSDYLRDNAYKPALTKGWIVPIDIP